MYNFEDRNNQSGEFNMKIVENAVFYRIRYAFDNKTFNLRSTVDDFSDAQSQKNRSQFIQPVSPVKIAEYTIKKILTNMKE